MRFLSIGFLLLCTYFGQAQSSEGEGLFVPISIQEAYEKGTRSRDGRPGPNYWQNEAGYQIEVSVDPETQTLSGEETVTYRNNSPDPLTQLVVRLMYDLYKKGSARDESLAPEELTDGVQLEYVALNGDTVDLQNRQLARRVGTNLFLRLPQPLAPDASLTFSTRWSARIPDAGIRVGAFDSTSYFVGYWYPQIAVYDDIDGWDRSDYTGRVEFYSDLADFDVRIRVPESYFVKATGVLQNAEEVFPAAMRRRYEEAQRADSTITIIDREAAESGYSMQSDTWHYVAEDVPDFAFFTSDHFIWEGTSQPVDDRRVFISTIYPPENAEPYQEVSRIQREVMHYFSTEITGIPYPYPAYSSINSSFGGGMEFPMLANNSAPRPEELMASLTAHEMHHMYFPFYVRINEKKYAWMDEGWADYITDLALGRELYGEDYWEQAVSNLSLILQGNLGEGANIPLMTASQFMGDENYGFSVYMYAHLTYMLLHEVLGEEMFVKCMREYIRRWAYKSPTPYDFFNTFENVSGQDLDWFWKPWYFEFGYPELSIESMEKNRLTVTRTGNRPVPVELDITYADGSTETIHESPAVWKEGVKSYTHKLPRKKQVEKVVLNRHYPEVEIADNVLFSEETLESLGDLSKYTGQYAVNPVVNVDIEATQGYLKMAVPITGLEAILFPDGDGQFSNLGGSMQVDFEESEDGKVTGLNANLFGNRFPAARVD